ncbi:MAG: galactonate dehydratase [Bryobacteraceae bacterium]|nr:MAG: galactonate dehydratase [Bryobacteraceae bacterium]
MRMSRRKMLAGLAAGAATAAGQAWRLPSRIEERLARLDGGLRQPVLKKHLFSSPVIIESLDLLRLGQSFLCRVRSRDGAEGMSVAHGEMRNLYPIFLRRLRPFFLGKDARELDLILERVLVYDFNYRFGGISLGVPLATIEFAILDMLGRIANKPAGDLIGELHHPQVGVYVATEWREKPVEESLELIRNEVAKYDAKALKIKVGGLMFMTTDMHASAPPGRTEKIIPLIRKTFGDSMALYADANGFYTVPEAIRVGRLLEEYKYRYFEEPVMFDHLEEIRQVSEALAIPVANGEQDHSFYGFRWLLAHDGLDIVQPDNYYFGGMIRSIRVARMAAACGRHFIPHMSGGGLGYVYNIQLVSVVPNAGEHHEFKGYQTHVRFECLTSPLRVVNGKIRVPRGPGFGVEFDPDWVKKHQPVTAA